MPGRPAQEKPAPARTPGPARVPGSVYVQVWIPPEEVAALDAIAATLAGKTGAIPSRTPAVRLAIRELHARMTATEA